MENQGYILTIDQGTTGTRSGLVDKNGILIGTAYQDISQKYPNDGWVEQDPEEIFNSVLHTTKKVLQDLNIDPSLIKSIGITNQRETTMLWDKVTGNTFGNAIGWQCTRTKDICDSIMELGVSEKVTQLTGLPIEPYFSATKISWIIDNTPGVKESIKNGSLAFGTMDTWLVWRLSSGRYHITDTTNASRTLLFDINRLHWSDELLKIFKIPKSILPSVVPSSGDLAIADPKYFQGNSIPITSIIGDQQSSLFGQFCWDYGDLKATYGTGAFLLMNTGKKIIRTKKGLLTTISWNINGQVEYALEGSVFSAGSAITWLKDKMKLIKTSKEIDILASKTHDNGGVYFVPAFTGLGAPHWNSSARATFQGITIENNNSHIARAILESIAFQCNDVVQLMSKETNRKIHNFVVDGGVSQSDILLQFQADITNIDIKRTETFESTALGAAYLSGLAVKFWNSMDELQIRKTPQKQFKPNMDKITRDNLIANWNKAVFRSYDWVK